MKIFILLLAGVFGFNQSISAEKDRFEIGADWLYWKAFQSNLEYATHVQGNIVSDVQQITPKTLFPDFQANNGFRVFAHYLFCDSLWEMGVIYTRLLSDARRNSEVSEFTIGNDFIFLNANNFPIFTILTQEGTMLSKLNSLWKSNFNYFDLDLARTISVCQRMSIVPHMGFRWLWFDQILSLEGNAMLGRIISNFKEQYLGFGVEGGLVGNIELFSCFSLIGEIGGSLLYAKLEVDEELFIFTTPNLSITVGDTIYHLSPTIDGFIGLQYQHCFTCGLLNLHVGWEQHIIINANRFTITSTDFTHQGLTLGGSLRF